MGLSFMSAFIIKNNEVNVKAYPNKEKTHYGFMVYMGDEKTYYKIINTPNCPYLNEEEALSAGERLVQTIKNSNLDPKPSKLEKILANFLKRFKK
jgi:hypothetical protein